MRIYSFENNDLENDGFFDLSKKTVVFDPSVEGGVEEFIVTHEFEGKLNLISQYKYNTPDYIEEIMVLNNIITPYSVKEGDKIYLYNDSNSYDIMYKKEEEELDNKDKILNINKKKKTLKDPNRIGYPPTIKPDNLKQLQIDHSKRKITLLNKFK